MASEWRNWAGDQRCAPASIEHPGSQAELIDAIEHSAEAGGRVRAAASGHSFTDIACTEGTMRIAIKDAAQQRAATNRLACDP